MPPSTRASSRATPYTQSWRQTLSSNAALALVCADYYGHGLLVLTNNGSGRFGSNTVLNTGLTVTWGTAADVNGDGKVDLIALENYGNAVVVFTNNSGGIFSSNASYAIGDYPVQAFAADLNNDGKVDLVSVNFFGESLSVLTNATVFPAASPAPALAIKRTSIGALVSWPSASAGWSLQQSATLTNKTWLPSGYGGYELADNGTNKSLAMPASPGNSYFRLLHP